MKIKELREMTVEELTARRRELKQESKNLFIQKSTDQLENPARIRLVRRELARIETLINERRKASATA